MVSTTAELRILVVADDPLARAGLAALLSAQSECNVTGQVPGGSDLVTALEVYLPDIVAWDLGWDTSLSLERLSDAVEVGPPIVALLPDESSAADVWIAGVRALLLRETTVERLVTSLRAVTQGLMILDPGLVDGLRLTGDASATPLAQELTPRELEVLQLMAEGLSNRAIAYRLDISEHTVKFHINAIMSKLGAQNRTDAAVRATRLGLIFL